MSQQAEKTPWRLIPLCDFQAPAAPTSEAVRNWLLSIWYRLHPSPVTSTSGFDKAEGELRAAPKKLLQQAAPDPRWSDGAAALFENELAQWLNTDELDSPRVVVYTPFSGLDCMVYSWATQRGFTTVAAPTIEDILSGGQNWLLDCQAQGNKRWLLPKLEHWYLRQENGLNLLRRWLDWLNSSPVKGLIVCNSWSWYYLNHVLHIGAFLPEPLTLSPVDAVDLACWFQMLPAQSPGENFVFRLTNSGKNVCAILEQKESDKPTVKSTFLEDVAARSRGNPGIAWHIWRHSMRIAVKEDVNEKAHAEAATDPGKTIWIRPWDKLGLPRVPAGAEASTAFLLHTLLLHGSATARTLHKLLPLPPAEIVRILQHLRDAGIVEGTGEQWSIAPLGYPAVRSFLAEEGYLIDV